MTGTIMANQAAHRGGPPAGNPFAITDDMLVAAVRHDDLDQAIAGVMEQVGITDGGVAGMVFSGDQDHGWWRTASVHARLGMLREWRDAEQAQHQED